MMNAKQFECVKSKILDKQEIGRERREREKTSSKESGFQDIVQV